MKQPSVDLLALPNSFIIISHHQRFTCISLGGKNHNVRSLLRESAKKGEWLCLKNLHLAIDSAHDLEQEFEDLHQSHYNGNGFKIWITTEMSDGIPSSLLTQSFKIVYETPAGLRESVQNTFVRWEKMSLDFNGYPKGQMFFILSWLHAVIHERGSLSNSGWSQNYDFNQGDISAAEIVFETYHGFPNAAEIIKHFLRTFVYGGKVINVCDELVLRTYIAKYFSDNILDGSEEIFPGLRLDRVWDNQSYWRALRAIPRIDSATYFGLPPNSFRSLNINLSRNVSEKLKVLKSQKYNARTSCANDWFFQVKTIIQHWESLTQNLLVAIVDQFDSDTLNVAMKFVASEIQHGQQIVRIVSSSIKLLKSVHNGEVDDSFLLFRKVRDALIKNAVPESWDELWSGPLEVTEWMAKVVNKVKALHLSIQKQEVISESSIDLSKFFRVQAFLSMLKMKFSIKSQNSMDEVHIFGLFETEFDVLSTESDCSIKVQPLHLRGFLLNENNGGSFTMQPMKASSPEFIRSPPIRLMFGTTFDCHLTHGETISIPVYSNLSSDKALFYVTVNCEKDSSKKWILAGPSLYLECGS